MITSVNTSATCSAIATVTALLAAITPPKALTAGRIACAFAVRVGHVRADRDAARVGVLDDRHARLGEVEGGPPRRVGVDVVVVGHRLAVQLLGGGDASGRAPLDRPFRRAVQRRPLVRVLAVAQHLGRLPGRAGDRGPAAVCAAISSGRVASTRTRTRRRRRTRRCARTPRRPGRCARSRVNPPSASAASTSRVPGGSVTTATLAWFFAAARTIAGPPMSICSTHLRRRARPAGDRLARTGRG